MKIALDTNIYSDFAEGLSDSLLNCEELRYPTCDLAVLTPIIGTR
ncbi:MAG: hypothetical protein V1792_24495 [Pseudomonadota bacterium]